MEGKTMKYKIYQLKHSRESDYSWMPWDFAEEHGFTINDYEEVYSGEIEQQNCLEKLFEQFNISRPENFTGHSMSMSDVVALKKEDNDYWYWYYCDSFGWKEITETVDSVIRSKNELLLCFGSAGYIYYKTESSSAQEAVKEILRAFDNAGINVDNLPPTYACLRDADGNDIDEENEF